MKEIYMKIKDNKYYLALVRELESLEKVNFKIINNIAIHTVPYKDHPNTYIHKCIDPNINNKKVIVTTNRHIEATFYDSADKIKIQVFVDDKSMERAIERFLTNVLEEC